VRSLTSLVKFTVIKEVLLGGCNQLSTKTVAHLTDALLRSRLDPLLVAIDGYGIPRMTPGTVGAVE